MSSRGPSRAARVAFLEGDDKRIGGWKELKI
jgi:hypothetical protein